MLFAIGCCFFLLSEMAHTTPLSVVRNSHQDMKKYEKNAHDLVRLSQEKTQAYKGSAQKNSSDSLSKKEKYQNDALALVQNLAKENNPELRESQKDQGCHHCAGNADVFENMPQEERKHKDKKGDILIFISFSMPKEVIKGLLQEAHEYEARVIIRGLIDNSWKKTAQMMQTIYGNIDLDPEAFEQYGVKAVPTFVHVKEEGFDTLKGNVPLSYVIKKFSIKDKEMS